MDEQPGDPARERQRNERESEPQLDLVRFGVAGLSFFAIEFDKIFGLFELRGSDMGVPPQNIGDKELTGKIFQDKELALALRLRKCGMWGLALSRR